MAIEFFGNVDKDARGKITSSMPAWYFDNQMDELKEGIDRKKRSLAAGNIKADQIPNVRAELEREQTRYEEIIATKPKLNGGEKNKLSKLRKELGDEIGDILFTRSEIEKNLASPHEELKRMKNPSISLTKLGIEPEILAACGLKHTDGKISRDQASTMYQIISKSLGEDTSIERLRHDGDISAFKSMNEMTETIMRRMQQGQQG